MSRFQNGMTFFISLLKIRIASWGGVGVGIPTVARGEDFVESEKKFMMKNARKMNTCIQSTTTHYITSYS